MKRHSGQPGLERLKNDPDRTPQSEPSQEVLLAAMRAFQQGDKDSFEVIYGPLWKAVRLRASKMGLAHQDCEEIAQKVLVRVYLYASPARFSAAQELWGWVYTITAREVYKHWRRRRPDLFGADPPAEWLGHRTSSEADPAAAAAAAEVMDAVGDCIGALADDERLYVLGPLVQGLTFRKAAAAHGLSLGQFKHRYQKALQRVRDCMRRKGHAL